MYVKFIYMLWAVFLLSASTLISYGNPVATSGDARQGVLMESLDVEIRGTVRDTAGYLLPGVSVVVKDRTTIGTTTDLNGKYFLEVPDGATVVFSLVGFEKQEIPVDGRELIDVSLTETTSMLDDVVVVAFGTQKKQDVIGAEIGRAN